jgi:hypothetical protein
VALIEPLVEPREQSRKVLFREASLPAKIQQDATQRARSFMGTSQLAAEILQ